MTISEKLYAYYLKKLAALKAENEKHDFSPEGEAAYDVAFAECKQAYHLLCDHDARLRADGMKAVYG